MHDKDLTVRDFVKREIPERRNANAILRALLFCGLDLDAPAESIMQKSADRVMWSYGIGIMRRSLYAQIREKIKNELEEKTMIDYGDDFVFEAREAKYDMPYHELDDIVAFIRNHEWEDIPDSIKDHLEKWEEFLTDNL